MDKSVADAVSLPETSSRLRLLAIHLWNGSTNNASHHSLSHLGPLFSYPWDGERASLWLDTQIAQSDAEHTVGMLAGCSIPSTGPSRPKMGKVGAPREPQAWNVVATERKNDHKGFGGENTINEEKKEKKMEKTKIRMVDFKRIDRKQVKYCSDKGQRKLRKTILGLWQHNLWYRNSHHH